jgi:hypothetical protein
MRRALGVFLFGGLVSTGLVACGVLDGSVFKDDPPPDTSSSSSGGFDGGFGNSDSGHPDAGDLYANDPPPKYCGPDSGGTPPPPITGTPECPSDKNKPGCACTNVGEEASCWTGLRVNRNLGICKDGKTKCVQIKENTAQWSSCEGEVLPDPSAKKGKQACRCFSQGQWKLQNTSPCFIDYVDSGGKPNGTYALSTVVDGAGKASCPNITDPTPPPAKPGSDWTTDTITADCAGRFSLCYTLKAGNFDAPSPSDCTLVKLCTPQTEYLKENVEQPFPNLPAWVSPDPACAKKFKDSGGYGEMTVIGESVLCDKIDDGAGNPYMFNRVKYCEFICNSQPTLPQCNNCQQGGSGQF